MDPDKTAPTGAEQSDLGAHCQKVFKTFQQRQKQTTFVVVAALRANK